MCLLRRLIHPPYHPVRIFIAPVLLTLFWLVYYENVKKSSVDFFESLQQQTSFPFQSELKSVHSENSSLFGLESTDSVLSVEDNLLKPEGFRYEGIDDNLLRSEDFGDEGIDDNLLRSEDFGDGSIDDYLLRPEGFGDEGIDDNLLRPEDFGDEGIDDNLLRSEDFGDEGIDDNLLSPEGFGDEGIDNNLLRPEGFGDEGIDDNLLRPEDFGDEGIDDNLLRSEDFGNGSIDDNLLKAEVFGDEVIEDNLRKPEGFGDEGTMKFSKKEGKKEEENATARRLRIRREKVLEVCRSGEVQGCHSLRGVLNFRMFFFHRYDTSVCTVAKSASSTWREHLRRVNKGPPRNKPIDNDKLRKAFLQRPIEDIIKKVKSSNKIITVRHPLTRLVSAFRNKYRDGKPMPPHRPRAEVRIHKRIAGSYWHERFHQFWLPALFANNMVPPNIHIKVGMQAPVDPSVLYSKEEYERLYRVLKPKVTFIQFLKFVVKTYEERESDAHWKPYYHNCCPCHFDYEYITKVETLSGDLEYVFKKLGIPANPNTSKNQQRENVDNTHSYFRYYQNVPTTLRREIYKYLKPDMDLFGYELPKNFLI